MEAARLPGFAATLSAAKQKLGKVDFEWYPYGTLTALTHLEKLLGESLASFLQRACPGRRVLDIGCGDGDLSFLLESLGYEVTAVDHPTHNHNGMRGVRLLKDALGSSIRILEMDLDRQFALPEEEWDAAILLGVLYHLRNPFYVLEELARRCRHCLLSTRVARRFPDGSPMPEGVALAYLLDEYELNNDETNYFIFSEPGLSVMVKRAYWNVTRSCSVGDAMSDPVRRDRDERAFCLLTSGYDRLANVELGDGWYESEGSGWRWTRRDFSLCVRVPAAKSSRHALSMRIFVSDQLLAAFGTVRLGIGADGRALPEAVFESSGLHTLIRHFDAPAGKTVEFRFRAANAMPGDESDARERALIVESVTVE